MFSPVFLLLFLSLSCLSTVSLTETITKSLHFFLNIETPQLGVPFIATCALSTPSSRNPVSLSLVSFYSSQAGLLASYETSSSHDGPWILSRRTHAQTHLAPGTQQTFPVYELTLVELNNTQQEYWCTVSGTYTQKSGLFSWKQSNFESVPSTHVFTYPQVNFSLVNEDGPYGNIRRATCSIGTFPHHGEVEYSVRYHLEPVNVLHGNYLLNQILAEYRIKPHQMVEFLTEDDPKLKVTVSSVAQPGDAQLEYGITASGKFANHATWWCVLAVSTEGTEDYREFSSNSEAPRWWIYDSGFSAQN